MLVTCSCEKQRTFDVNGADEERLEKAISAGQKMIMIQCRACSRSIPLNPQTLSRPMPEVEKKHACPVSGCDGLVVHVSEGNFWGCGECGSVWADECEINALPRV